MTSDRIQIEIQARLKKPVLPSVRIVRDTKKILRSLKLEGVSLSLLFVDDRQIRKLNRLYLQEDRPTDVMAFSQLEGAKLTVAKRHQHLLGDIVISTDTVQRQAEEYGTGFYYELIYCLCHGILHLLGMDDGTVKEKVLMERKQKRILSQIKIKSGLP